MPGIVQDKLDHSLHTADIVSLLFMVMPGLDNLRVNGREIDLPEFPEDRFVTPHHFHEPAPLIGDNPEIFYLYTFDHNITWEQSPRTNFPGAGCASFFV